MAGLRGHDRTPREDVRVRRNSQRLSSNFTQMLGNGFEVDANGLIAVDVQDPIFVDGSGVGLNYSTGLDLSGSDLVLSHLGLESLTNPGADRIMFWDNNETALKWLTVSTGLQISTTDLTTKDSEIVHDNLSGFVANEHIDWTNATAALTTSNTIQGGTLTDGVFTVGGGVITGAFFNQNIDIGGASGARRVGMSAASGDGEVLSVQAGGTIATDGDGGALLLKSGFARGDGSSYIDLMTVVGGQGTGSTQRHPTLRWRITTDGNLVAGTDGTGVFSIITAGTLSSHDIVVTGDGTNPALTVNQGGDLLGLKVVGFDDQSAEYFVLFVNNLGYGLFSTTNRMYFSSGGTMKFSPAAGHIEFTTVAGGYIWLHSDGDIYLNLGDAAGAEHFYLRDSDNAVIFDVDSDGNGEIVGSWKVGGQFGCNGAAVQGSVAVNAASADLATVIALCNQLRAALIANGICV